MAGVHGNGPCANEQCPHGAPGYDKKAAWDRQVRVVQRLVVTLYLAIGQDKAVDAMEAEYSPNKLFKLFFAFLTSLSRDIGSSRKQAVDRRFEPADPTPLLTKDDLKNITAANPVCKDLRGNMSRTAPYPPHYRSYGGTRVREKGGKGRGKAGGKGKDQHRQRFTFGDNKPGQIHQIR